VELNYTYGPTDTIHSPITFANVLSITELCEPFEISRKTGYKFIDRYLRLGQPPAPTVDGSCARLIKAFSRPSSDDVGVPPQSPVQYSRACGSAMTLPSLLGRYTQFSLYPSNACVRGAKHTQCAERPPSSRSPRRSTKDSKRRMLR
jgi:hypothetical protein